MPAAEPVADRTVGPVRAIGRLAPDGPWAGFARAPDGYRLVFGTPDGAVHADPIAGAEESRSGLLAAAVAFFLSALPPPPAELEATQADVAALIRYLGETAADDATAHRAQLAIDAIDDGLPGEAVALRIGALSPEVESDPAAILAERCRRALRTSPD